MKKIIDFIKEYKKIMMKIVLCVLILAVIAVFIWLFISNQKQLDYLSQYNKTAITSVFKSENKEEIFSISSPDNSLTAAGFIDENGVASYTVTKDSREVIHQSNLGIITSIADFSVGSELLNVSDIEEVSDPYQLVCGKFDKYENCYNQGSFSLVKDGVELNVVFRAYDDGIAFCYEISADDDFEIYGDNTNFIIDGNSDVWRNERYKEQYEFNYVCQKARSLNKTIDNKYILMPVLIQNESGTYIQISEANVNSGYCGIMLYPMNKDGKTVLQSSFVKSQSESVKANSNFTSSWKYIVIGDEADVVENTMATDLAEEPDENVDYSFVKSGSTSWSWLDCERDMDVWGGEYQHNTDEIKKCIDLASQMGWQYYIMDEGWQPQSENEDEHYSGYYDEFDEWASYAKDNNVGLIAWCYSSDLNTSEKRERLRDWAQHGIVGIKVDFFDYENQETLQLYEDIYKECAEQGLIVIAHGANKSTGEERTYPNVLTKEGIYGQEQGSVTAQNAVTCVFTRFAVGNTDYTEYFVPRQDNVNIGFQTAMSFMYISGVHCFADGKTNYVSSSEANDLFFDFPSSYDETVYVDGNPSDYVIIARRSGDTWYVSGISAKEVSGNISLDFLTNGKTYTANIYFDSDDYTKLNTETAELTSDDSYDFTMKKNGGFVIKLTEK